MSGFRVLSDDVVHDILINLSKPDILRLRDSLLECLMDISTGLERQYQPEVGVVNRPEGQRCLFRPFSSSTSFGTKVIVTPAPSSSAAGSLHGIIAVCDQDGHPTGVINAEEVTGYRTALSALIPYMWRRHTDNIVVFGAGKQALWHLRLALALRGDEITTITIVNRSEQRAQQLITTIKEENQARWKSPSTFEYLDPSLSDYQARLQYRLAVCDAIFCTVGTTAPVFPSQYVTNGKRNRYPYISAVGSWQEDMMELDPELLVYAIKNADESLRQGSGSKVAVLVDDRTSALKHSGEIVQSKVATEHLVEIGEVETSRRLGQNNHWLSSLEDGLLIYKSIGVSTTDLAIGNAILAFAEEQSVGIEIPNF